MSGFLGLPVCTDLASLDAEIAVIGLPGATPYPGATIACAGGPAAIRAAMAPRFGTMGHYDFDVDGPLFEGQPRRAADCGDLPLLADAAANRAAIRAAITTILARGAIPVGIGGDDSVQIPLFEAFAGRGPFTLLQIDAHIDWRDELAGERHGLSSTMRRAAEQAHVTRLVQVGARATGSARPSDVADARAWGVHLVTARALHRDGIGQVLDLIPSGAEVLVAFDCDGLDPAIMPAVTGLSPGGLSYWQAIDLLHGVAAKARFAGFNLVEFAPANDVNGTGALVAGRILANVLGLMARQG